MIVSLLYQLTRRLLSVPAVLLRRDVAKDAELLVLRHENAVLRRQITGQVRYSPTDRLWFAALSSLLPWRRRHAIFLVRPATILAWNPLAEALLAAPPRIHGMTGSPSIRLRSSDRQICGSFLEPAPAIA